ncbi:hypothetical protein [Rubellicoccus peritrichatus]|uniref:Uncharacterized protein n=1 Tax=Rubellicoccus peritrichatus TaxID=3080537 RepID=A0AAQ3LE90_9BACT|nr:hypothetical protein [Puniceicoccus sp. CR14]WOO43057.1 hypothetical protein RZN69_08120 [Puniceicoccus sp. CR14]
MTKDFHYKLLKAIDAFSWFFGLILIIAMLILVLGTIEEML